MNRLRIIPLDGTVVFPGMPVTLPVDVGSDTRVLLVPRRDDTYSKVGIVAEVSERMRLGGRGVAVSLTGLHRATLGSASADQDGVLRVDYEARPDEASAANVTRELEREYRAVVDEILELRGDDGRIRAFVRSITDDRRAGRHGGLFARLELRSEAAAPRNASTSSSGSSSRCSSSESGWRSCRCESASTTMSRTARRSSSASTFCAGRWTPFARSLAKPTARSPTSTARRLRTPACPTRCGSRPNASWIVSSGWAIRTPSPR